jgi:hypothetical protein
MSTGDLWRRMRLDWGMDGTALAAYYAKKALLRLALMAIFASLEYSAFITSRSAHFVETQRGKSRGIWEYRMALLPNLHVKI